MQRYTILIAVAAVVLLAVAGFLVWQHLSRLGDQIADLGRQVDDLSGQVTVAEGRAAEAEARAERAEHEAGEAASRAEEASVREEQTAEEARQAKQEAERAAAARQEAELKAEQSTSARLAAEAKQEAAEKRRADALMEAEAARLEAREARAEAEKIRRRKEAELDRMQRALSRIAETRRTALGLVMNLDSSHVEFDFDKADLRPEDRELLSRIAGVLLTFEDYSVQVFGHTDDVGTEEYNQELSERRAAAVRNYLVEAGVPPDILTTQGLGKSSPLVEGSDPESRQRNRRVEVGIVFSEGEYGEVAAEQ